MCLLFYLIEERELKRAQVLLGNTFASSYLCMYQLYTTCLASATGAFSHQSRLYGDC